MTLEINKIVRGLTQDQLVTAIDLLGGGNLDADKNFVRATLLGEYERRYGGEACDRFMTALGM